MTQGSGPSRRMASGTGLLQIDVASPARISHSAGDRQNRHALRQDRVKAKEKAGLSSGGGPWTVVVSMLWIDRFNQT